MSSATASTARTFGNVVLGILFLLALLVSGRRLMEAWTAGAQGEMVFWLLVTLGTASLTIRAVRRALRGARTG